MLTDQITLLIFTCEGREHLLKETIASFKKKCRYPFTKTILAVDGQINNNTIDWINPDLVIQSPVRKGYVNSILHAIKQVDTAYFFWLEDDWEFPYDIPICELALQLDADPQLIQIVLAKAKKETMQIELTNPSSSFSANPGLCNAMYIKNGFQLLQKSKKIYDMGFEDFMKHFMEIEQLSAYYIYQNNGPFVHHSGYLESTAREYHMISSIDAELSLIGKKYISGYGNDKTITLKNKLLLVPRLWLATTILALKLFRNRQSYDFALRIYFSYLRNFKY
ncbi:glycosyltransferase [Pedobacter hiemivivus]|uniref:Glycosyltransferase n=1 Tax=Pedobacter hiemivivus TaxID=2530454 RepID=A0A4U1GHP6_9SPHI|nr:glycosyltransferase [Pedobacter hiemivivus]TKC60962.1 glycosyltransferase [Pedobacter hiemivivus]